jgi:hypothetical protein
MEQAFCVRMRGNTREQPGSSRYASNEGSRAFMMSASLQEVVTLFGSRAVFAFLCAGKLIGINCIGITLHLWHVICMVPVVNRSAVSHRHASPIFVHEFWSAGQADLDGPVAYPRKATAFARAPQGNAGFFLCVQRPFQRPLGVDVMLDPLINSGNPPALPGRQ